MNTSGTIRRIQQDVAQRYGVSIWEMRSDRQGNAILGPRHLAMWQARRQGHSFRAIGQAFNRDHTTVMYAVDKMAKIDGELA